ncbi:MAG: hypothetical protein DRZ76_00770 [Candidatus Nealsonbacteria bacterium]|nr:MAG: hypothetical protein DRZ76_00770 [Candidatus Nealsonbacteria bacterium]
MKKLVIAVLVLVIVLIAIYIFGANGPSTQPAQNTPEPETPSETLVDTDRDGLSDWFEKNIADLDPLVPNDRYAIILNTITIHYSIPYYTKQRREETTNLKTFLIEEEKFASENVFLFMDMEATYDNFKSAVDCLAEISDENDLVYIFIQAHGGPGGFVFHSGIDPSEIEISDELIEQRRDWYSEGTSLEEIRKAQQDYEAEVRGKDFSNSELSQLLGKIKHNKMFLLIEWCHSNEAIYEISGERLVVITDIPLSQFTEKLILGIVSPYALYRNLEYDIRHTNEKAEKLNTLPLVDDGNGYPSIKEICRAFDESPNIKEVNGKAVITDPQNLADNFYFGEAEIGNYRETDLYLLSYP